MSFAKRITKERLFGGPSPQAFESDRGRIINSAAIRRLQQKTQVFPLERNAAVRSRLTHSMEVLQVGRFIVQKITAKLRANQENDTYSFLEFERDIETLVEMACLLHDIGNPPFGHFGEYAIGRWFKQHLEKSPLTAVQNSENVQSLAAILQADLSCFEGNAQAMRLIHSLLRLNLTYSQSACIIKYTRAAFQQKPSENYLQKKPGYYLPEKPFIDSLYQSLQMSPNSRFPLTYIMEAADDISYGVADMEDAVEKGIFTYESLATCLKENFKQVCEKHNRAEPRFTHFGKQQTIEELIDDCLKQAHKEPINKTHEFFIRLRVAFNHILAEHAAQQFITHQDDVFKGCLNRSLLEDEGDHQLLLDTIKQLSVKHIFSHKEVETLELQGNKILVALLDEYAPLLSLSHTEFKNIAENGRDYPLEHRLFNRLPKQYVSAYSESLKPSKLTAILASLSLHFDEPCDDLWERYFRCRLLIDFISGMTDQQALDEYHALCVIK